MGRTPAIVVTLGALAFAGAASAHGDHHAKGAKVYRAALTKGKAHLVDGKKHNKLTIHLRGLTAGQTYIWQLHKAASATSDPCSPAQPVVVGSPYGDWAYGALVANDAGNASAKATSATFDSRADTGPFYVEVHLGDGTVIACGVLKAKTSHGKHNHASKHLQPRHDTDGKGPGHGGGQGHDD